MKKNISILLAVALIFTLCACEGVGNVELPPLPTPTEEATQPSAAPETETPAPTEEPAEARPQTIVAIKRTELEAFDPQYGTTLILSFDYDTPTVFIQDNSAAAEAINEYTALMDETYYTGEDYGDGMGTGYQNMLTMAEDNYNYLSTLETADVIYEMASSQTVTVERNDAQVLTLLYNNYSFTGGAHGFYGERGYCFDAGTGELLTLDSISDDAEALKSFLAEKMVAILENDTELLERIDQTLIPEEGLSAMCTVLLRDGSWYFSRDGLVIFSDLYEYSSYAAGPIEFSIPYAELSGHVKAGYLPEQSKAECSLGVMEAAKMTDGSMEILDKVTVSAEGQELYFTVEGRIEDVKLASVEYSDKFYETAQLWSCSYMQDCALQIKTLIPEGMPDLMISYTDKDGRHNILLTESGEDGSLILMDDSIEAVG